MWSVVFLWIAILVIYTVFVIIVTKKEEGEDKDFNYLMIAWFILGSPLLLSLSPILICIYLWKQR